VSQVGSTHVARAGSAGLAAVGTSSPSTDGLPVAGPGSGVNVQGRVQQPGAP